MLYDAQVVATISYGNYLLREAINLAIIISILNKNRVWDQEIVLRKKLRRIRNRLQKTGDILLSPVFTIQYRKFAKYHYHFLFFFGDVSPYIFYFHYLLQRLKENDFIFMVFFVDKKANN